MLYSLEHMKSLFVITGIIAITILELVAMAKGVDGYALAIAVGGIASIATGSTVKLRARNHRDNPANSADPPPKK